MAAHGCAARTSAADATLTVWLQLVPRLLLSQATIGDNSNGGWTGLGLRIVSTGHLV